MTWNSVAQHATTVAAMASRISVRTRSGIALCLLGLLLQACVSNPVPTVPPGNPRIVVPPRSMKFPLPRHDEANPGFSVGGEVVVRAIALLGTPYRYGGDDLGGFDCSGLVRYIYNELGIDVPRTAAEQYKAASAIDIERVEPGDLLFFRTQGDGVSHVAIYAGSGRFVHAPQTGRNIELREIGDGYYRSRLIGAGRLFPMDGSGQ